MLLFKAGLPMGRSRLVCFDYRTTVKWIGILFTALFISKHGYSQITYTSADNKQTDWTASSTWTLSGGSTPTTPGNPTSGSVTAINIYGYLRSEVTLNVDNGSPTITIYDTLYVNGDLNLGQGKLIIQSGGLLVVKGNLNTYNGLNQLTNNGNVVVTGNLNNSNGAITNPSNHLYVYGSTNVTNGGTINGCNPYGGCTPASQVQTQSQLQSQNSALYDFVNSGGVLPVRLLFFNAIHTNGTTTATWATASELNFDYFNVQRSYDGKKFETIAEVKGHGTTDEQHNYSYIDLSPISGLSYYRLQSVDFDKYTETFTVVSVDAQVSKNIALYPIPVTDSNLYFQLNFMPKTDVIVTVYSTTGIERMRGFIKANETLTGWKFSLEPGMYVVKMSSIDFSKTSRIIIQ